MRVSESVQWIVIYYWTFAQTALTESFELKSETVDLFIVFQGNFNQASPVGYLYLHVFGIKRQLGCRKCLHCFYDRLATKQGIGGESINLSLLQFDNSRSNLFLGGHLYGGDEPCCNQEKVK